MTKAMTLLEYFYSSVELDSTWNINRTNNRTKRRTSWSVTYNGIDSKVILFRFSVFVGVRSAYVKVLLLEHSSNQQGVDTDLFNRKAV